LTGTSDKQQRRILVLGEREGREVSPTTLELLQMGKMLAEKTGCALCLALLGSRISDPADHAAGFCEEVYCIDDPLLEEMDADVYLHALEKLCRAIVPDVVLIGHTPDHLEIAPRLAYRLGSRVISDCVSLDMTENGLLLCTKPIFGDKFLSVFATEGRPMMATVRPKSVGRISERNGKGYIVPFDAVLETSSRRTELVEIIPGDMVRLDKAEAIVAAGRAIKGRDGLAAVEELAGALRSYFTTAEVGASRPLVDAGLLPRSRQVGQTGERVAPRIYFAVGISGATQHVSGMSGSHTVVAINKDGEAPIFEVADYGVVGQYEQVLPALIQKLRELR
jgi:electron transfer flavoprotein alpha subunit